MATPDTDSERLLAESFRRERKILALAILVVAAICALIVWASAWAANRQKVRWEAFLVTNECRKVAVVKGGVGVSPVVGAGVGFSPSGQVMTGSTVGASISIEDDKTAWLCKDGVTYWR